MASLALMVLSAARAARDGELGDIGLQQVMGGAARCVSAYVEVLTRSYKAPTVKQRAADRGGWAFPDDLADDVMGH